MNRKQRNDANENEQAKHTAEVLEADPSSLSGDDLAMNEIGQLLLESAEVDLPPANEELRDQLLGALEEPMPVAAGNLAAQEQVVSSGVRKFWIAAAASGLVMVGGWFVYSDYYRGTTKRYQSEMASSPKPTISSLAIDSKRKNELDFSKADGELDLKVRTYDDGSGAGMAGGNIQDLGAPVQNADGENAKGDSKDIKELLARMTDKFSASQPESGSHPSIDPAKDVDRKKSSWLAVGGPVSRGPKAQPSASGGNGEEIAEAKKQLDELIAQKEQLFLVRKYGAGHPNFKAWDSTIKKRQRQLNELGQMEMAKGGKGFIAGGRGMGGGGMGAGGWAYSYGVDGKSAGRRFKSAGKGEAVFFDDVAGMGMDISGSRSVDFEFESKLSLAEGKFSGEQYIPIRENAFLQAIGSQAISTFSIDVDTASYSNMRRFLNSGQRPPANSVRIEELINYFTYDYPQPQGDDPFSMNTELAACPWSDGHQLLRVGLQGKDVHVEERPATNVVFLMDVSGSMKSPDKLPLLKQGFQMMVQQLNENDTVSIVTYAGNAGVALSPTNGSQTKVINDAIEQLSSGGSTHGSAGIQLAYQLAQENFIKDGVNKVILATDGDLNVGVTRDGALVKLIKQKAAEGVFLTVLGFGTGNLKDGKLEQLADNGNGMYAYIDSTREAHRVLVEQMSGSLVTIAKDVKIQIEFNPAVVKSYRLIGYENRVLATEDFDNDLKDAGEIGAGHSVTAIYEIEPVGAVNPVAKVPAGIKYQINSVPKEKPAADAKIQLSDAAATGELATVALRYKQPDANESKRIEVAVTGQAQPFAEATSDFRFASTVAGFGMLLRNSKHRGSINSQHLLRSASQSIGDDASGYRAEFIDLIRKYEAIR